MKSSSFQIILMAVFGFIIVVAMVMFSGVFSGGGGGQTSTLAGTNVTVWGTFSNDILQKVFADFSQQNNITVSYVQKNPATFDQDLVEALASGVGPDIIFAPQDVLLKHRNKLVHIPYTTYQERTFRDTFVQGGEVYFMPDGILALPVLIDPLILYYNRTLFENEGYQYAPKTWEDIRSSVSKLTQKDASGNIKQSTIPFGTFTNLPHAKDILTMLLLQVGNPIYKVSGDATAPYYQSTLDQGSTSTQPTGSTEVTTPVEAVVSFFTQFSDPAKDTYSWNKILPNARDAFVNETLAQYIGYASELPTIALKNPNLNFDVGIVPQVKDAKSKLTFGQVYGLAIVKTSRNQVPALQIIQMMTTPQFVNPLLTATLQKFPIAPARRDLLTAPPGTLYGPTLYNSALIARAWFDPNSDATYAIFAKLINDVVRGSVTLGAGIQEAATSLSALTAPNL